MDRKCMASQGGVCNSVHAFGVKCSGFSTECKLRPAYNSLQAAAENAARTIKRMYGIKGDGE